MSQLHGTGLVNFLKAPFRFSEFNAVIILQWWEWRSSKTFA